LIQLHRLCCCDPLPLLLAIAFDLAASALLLDRLLLLLH
jgi:hypothetical protein